MERISKKQWSSIFESMVQKIEEGVIVADALKEDQPIIFINKGFSKITGYSREEALGKNPRFLQGPDTNPKAAGIIQNCIKNRKSGSVNLVNYKKDGTKFWNHFSIAPIKNEKGKVTYWIGIQRDISSMVEVIESKSQTKSMTTTLNTMNDIINNFMNTILYLRQLIEELNDYDNNVLDEFDFAFESFRNDILRLSNIEKYKEKKLHKDFSVLDIE